MKKRIFENTSEEYFFGLKKDGKVAWNAKKHIPYIYIYILMFALGIGLLSGCGAKKDDVVIYTSLLDYRREYLTQRLEEEFPQYQIRIEYMPTGSHAAKLLAEGLDTECDITTDLEYAYLQQLDGLGVLADLSEYDHSIYVPDAGSESNFLPKERSGGAIILNTKLLEEKGLPTPTCYQDLLKPEYQGLISMPGPKETGTGYVFLKSLVNAWGEEAAFDYFDQLTPNILQYTSAGSGPVNAVVQGEAVIGLGMISPAAREKTDGAPIEITFFEEGSPYALYGQAIIKGKEEKPAVKEVFDFLIHTYDYEDLEKYAPEKIYADVDFEMENFPKNVKYADMSNNTLEEKERLLDLWKY